MTKLNIYRIAYNDKQTYTRVNRDPIAKDFQNYLKDCHDLRLIDTYTLNMCTPSEEPRTQKFYMLRKMHKDPWTNCF